MKEFAQLNGEEINDQPSNFKDRAKDSLRRIKYELDRAFNYY